MNRCALFERSVAILVRAYLDGTLGPGNEACAVAHLVADANGSRVHRSPMGHRSFRPGRAGGVPAGVHRWISGVMDPRPSDAHAALVATGYTAAEARRIIRAFDAALHAAPGGYAGSGEDGAHRGLLAAVDALQRIHGGLRATTPSAPRRAPAPSEAWPGAAGALCVAQREDRAPMPAPAATAPAPAAPPPRPWWRRLLRA
jgi:hypothetical protein